MAKTMTVKPAEGRVVPDPDRGDELPAGGRAVPRSAYWRRRVAANDVIEVGAASAETAPAVPAGDASAAANTDDKGAQ
ncbi:conserved hypothetical protein [Paraburkholderia tropica]|uniref:DUF2635 domain-containing protein n=1 Tax=Paraburkholderia tropica TaxID=92647 RepID=UPI001CAC12AC|nr:DUF2635 domain-containing protein [Paraburkholderia tropica]CAG9195883.1 conserved hypothetical protein [Paraburkholderia tropica]